MKDEYIKWPGGSGQSIMISEYFANTPVKTHKHDFLEIVFIMGGSCSHRYLSHEKALTEGDVFIVAPHEEHSYEIKTKTEIINCILYPSVLGPDWVEIKQVSGLYNFIVVEPLFRFETNENELLHFSPDELIHIKHFLGEIKNEQQNRQKGYQLVQKANLLALLTYIGRKWEACFGSRDTEYDSKRILIDEAIAYIASNIQNELTVEKVASKVFLSPDYFRKLFKDATGSSPIKYINSLRMAKAEALLKDTDLSIGDVAQAVGIHDANYFSKLFYTTFNTSPSDYRKMTEFYE